MSFPKHSPFSQCGVCSALKGLMANTKVDMNVRKEARVRLRIHLAVAKSERAVYQHNKLDARNNALNVSIAFDGR